ncbi:MAG TPA: hypothetical protein VMU88_08945 [bacterium]|nr:hypothetical protein [bacterium]
MITPTHALYNLALLGRRDFPARTGPVLLGAFFPDLPGSFCLFWCGLVQGLSFKTIHDSVYPSPFWQGLADRFHSIPLALLFGGLCLLLKWAPGAWFALSACLHSLEDLPVHSGNPHRHFWPLSDWRFYSPFSCYDPHFHLGLVAAIDFALALLAAWVIAKRGIPTAGRWALGAALALEAGHSLFALARG